jgi:hypothetical protein
MKLAFSLASPVLIQGVMIMRGRVDTEGKEVVLNFFCESLSDV